jgi:hypothetical protein
MKPQWKHIEDRVHELLGEDVMVTTTLIDEMQAATNRVKQE